MFGDSFILRNVQFKADHHLAVTQRNLAPSTMTI